MFKSKTKPITKEQYERSVNGKLTPSDKEKVFTHSELYGFGIADVFVHHEGNRYYVSYTDLSERRHR